MTLWALKVLVTACNIIFNGLIGARCDLKLGGMSLDSSYHVCNVFTGGEAVFTN